MKKRWMSALLAALLALGLCATVACKDPEEKPDKNDGVQDETSNDNEVNISDLIK